MKTKTNKKSMTLMSRINRNIIMMKRNLKMQKTNLFKINLKKNKTPLIHRKKEKKMNFSHNIRIKAKNKYIINIWMRMK